MKKKLVELAKATLELWEVAQQMKTPGLFEDEEPLFDNEPKCVTLAKEILKDHGE